MIEKRSVTEKETSVDHNNIIKTPGKFLPSLTISLLSSQSTSPDCPDCPTGKFTNLVDQFGPQSDSSLTEEALIQNKRP